MIRNQRGQTSIFLALFIATMVMLFAFTTNIGMLVHAKINLQNAADAAAYAGAAVQARQLTTVAYLNYEMRRALKQYLYLYMVRGSKDQSCFPRDATGNPLPACSAIVYDANGRYPFRIADPRYPTNEVGGPFVPATCVAFTPQTNNYCAAFEVPGIPTFQGGGFFGIVDPVVQQIITAQNVIIKNKSDDCKDRTASNEVIFFSWLFNTDPLPSPTRAVKANHDTEILDPFDGLSGIDSLGYLVRYAMLRARIDNLEESLNLNLANEGMPVTITSASIDRFNSAKTPNKTLDYFERPLQAYLSAINNLPDININNGIFTSVKLTELLPNQIGNVPLNPHLKNPPILAKFNDLSQAVNVANSAFEVPPGNTDGKCRQYREIRTLESFPYGVTKDPNVLTYYAVRLEAKVRLLFSPMPGDGMVTISAYSAAKPFGSRIGKDLNQKPSDYMTAMAKLTQTALTGDEVATPNILVGKDDVSTGSDGFARSAHLGYLFNAMLQLGIDSGFELAGAYTPWEIGFYTPPANFSKPADMGTFADNPVYNSEGVYTLSAPIIPVNGGDSSLSFLRNRVNEYLNGSLAGQGTINQGKPLYIFYQNTVLSDAAFSSLFAYLTEKKLSDSHPVLDPLLNNRPDIVNWAKSNGGESFTVAAMQNAQQRQLTSWNNYKNAVGSGLPAPNEMELNTGRAGYSVRFVSFPSLTAGGRSSNDPAETTNFPNPFTLLDAVSEIPKLKDDISKLKH